YGDQHLATFLHESRVELSDILRRGSKSWTQLRRDAGMRVRPGGSNEDALLKRVRALTHVDDPDRAAAYSRLLDDEAPSYDELSEVEQRFTRMLLFSLWPGGGFATYDNGLAELRGEQAVRDELRAVIEIGLDHARHRAVPLNGSLASCPLRVHARYQREEILAALDYAGLTRRPNSMREGVLKADAWESDAFLVTLHKSESDYSPTTMYSDYAISPTLFHWESQSTTSERSPTGQRYIGHRAAGRHILFFSREHKENEYGTAPYLFLGTAH